VQHTAAVAQITLAEQAGIIYGGEKWMKDNNVAKDHPVFLCFPALAVMLCDC
jgi:hypothetical protein